jgi:hypothetical protein
VGDGVPENAWADELEDIFLLNSIDRFPARPAFGQTLHYHRLACPQSNLRQIHVLVATKHFYPTILYRYRYTTQEKNSKQTSVWDAQLKTSSTVQRISKVGGERQILRRMYIWYNRKSAPQRQSSNKNQDQIADTHADILTEIQQPT